MSTGAAHHAFINQRTSFPSNHYSSSRPSTPPPPPLKVCAAAMTCEFQIPSRSSIYLLTYPFIYPSASPNHPFAKVISPSGHLFARFSLPFSVNELKNEPKGWGINKTAAFTVYTHLSAPSFSPPSATVSAASPILCCCVRQRVEKRPSGAGMR